MYKADENNKIDFDQHSGTIFCYKHYCSVSEYKYLNIFDWKARNHRNRQKPKRGKITTNEMKIKQNRQLSLIHTYETQKQNKKKS